MSGCCQVPVPLPVTVQVPIQVPVPIPVPVPDCYSYQGLTECRLFVMCVFPCHSVTTERCCALLSVAHTASHVALLAVLLFNGDVQTPNVLSHNKYRLNTFNILINNDNNISLYTPSIQPAYDILK